MKARKNSAPFYLYEPLLLFCMGVIAVLVLFANILTPTSIFDEHRQQVLLSPSSPFAHLALAEDFQKNNQTTLAKKELEIINALPSEDTLLLQDSTKRLTRLTEGKETLLGIHNTLLADRVSFPHYRDLSLHLAVVSWQLKKDEEAKAFFKEAQILDPNSKSVKSVEQLLTEGN